MKFVLVLFVIVILTKCVLSEEDSPQTVSSPNQYYQLGRRPGTTVVCVEVSHGPHKSGVTKICGPPVMANPSSSGTKTSTSRSADSMMMLPDDMYVTYPLPMLRQAAERGSGEGCNLDKQVPGRFESGMVQYAPNYAGNIPFANNIPNSPKMAMDAPKEFIFGVNQVMEKSSGCSDDITSWPMRTMPSFPRRYPVLTGKENQPINPWLSLDPPIMNPLPMVKAVQLPPSPTDIAGSPSYTSNGRTSTLPQDMMIEKLKQECEEKDKEILDKNSKIEDLQKQLAMKKSSEEAVKAISSSMTEQKVKRNESPNITQIDRKN